mmetsp:Transcript_81880/g.230471  ORF Transcript_81880/g.230471 Transcript_81880/m.230471 type:complete len:254 (-) Transcript_81880:171-932(-)
MLLPMNLGAAEADEEAPRSVKDFWSKLWWVLFGLLLGVAVMDLLGGDVFGVLFLGSMSFVVYYMVSNDCKQMTQYCLMLFGMMVLIQAVFDTVTLMTLVGGRTIQHRTVTTVLSPDGRPRTQNIKIDEETHPFFDRSQDLTYNIQSAARIASPVAMALGALLSYWSYNAYPSGLLAAADDIRPFAPQGAGMYGGPGQTLGGGGGRPPATFGPSSGGFRLGGGGSGGSFAAGPQPSAGNGPRLWEGNGQRLGND